MKASGGQSELGRFTCAQVSCIWCEVAIIFTLQMGDHLGGQHLDLCAQADAFRLIAKRAWSKSTHEISGSRVSANLFWKPWTRIASLRDIAHFRTRGDRKSVG